MGWSIALPCNVCPVSAFSVWTSMFSIVSASLVPLSLTTILPSRKSSPIHLWFVSRCNTGCDRVVAATPIPFFKMKLDSRRGCAPPCLSVAHLSGRSQASQILRIKCTQSGCNSGPNANDSFFHVWAEQRDPKLPANKQPGLAHGRRAPGMSVAI